MVCFNGLMIKKILITLFTLITIAALSCVAVYGYLMLYAAFTWQCNIYVGPRTVEAQQTCDRFNEVGLIRLLTF